MSSAPADWTDCIDKNFVRRITPDISRANSLIETAEERIAQTPQKLHEKNVNFVFEDYYTSILEALQAIALFLGYKISNHVCLCYFLREHLGREDLSRVFDDLRFKRNMLVYYGKRMEFSIALEAINHSKMLFSQLTNIFRELKNRYSK